ncbi:aconitase X catalytic domain-containing protein [Thermogladius sp. 4427co]|uniref:aconitase X catalytic domain-containing protein n=1 Tax=Thermogladius sp. 4427co TaxID=3450718 RepID=UPI003F790068
MYLTVEQEKMLKGEYGWAVAKALEIIVKTGEALGAPRLVSIVHAHVSGVSYSNILEPGLAYIRSLFEKGGRARVYTTINPGCVDYSGFSEVIDNSLRGKQQAIDEALIGMGFKPVFTCIPYYHRPPSPGEFLAWGESSAVAVANSVYGASSNREGGPLTIAAAITGYTYYAGLHVPENRVASVIIEPGDPRVLDNPGALGLWIGENIRDIPLLKNARIDFYGLKILLASSAASGSHALIVLENITPTGTFRVEASERVMIEYSDIEKYSGTGPLNGDVLGYIGCPHLHPGEFLEIYYHIIRRGRLPAGSKLLLTIPVEVYKMYSDKVHYLRKLGVDVAVGTCPVVSRLARKFDGLVTNSGKAVFYLARYFKNRYLLTNTEGVLRAVYGQITG